MKYTYSDDEDMIFSDSTLRRSTRNTGTHTPAEPSGPVTTSSGRQIKAPDRLNVISGDSPANSVKGNTPEFDKENSVGATGRPRRSAAANQSTNGWGDAGSRGNRDTSPGSDEDESEAEFGDDEEDADVHVPEESEDEDDYDEDEAMVDDDLDEQPSSLVVKLSLTPPQLKSALAPVDQGPEAPATPNFKENGKTSQSRAVDMTDLPRPGAEAEPVNGVAVTMSTLGSAENKPSEKTETLTPVTSTDPLTEKTTNVPSTPATSLAFRGSPEKVQDHAAFSATNVNKQE